MGISDLNDEQLAELSSREGSDGPAFVALVERFQQRVWRVCYRLMGNAEDAHDAAQDVFVKLFVNRSKFQGKSKYSTWVHGVALRTCLTMRRSRWRRERHETEAGQHSASQNKEEKTASYTETSLDLMQILSTLDEEERALLIMKYSEGHEYEELADMFDMSVSACKMRVSRSRQKLKDRFPEHRFFDASD